MSSQKKHLRRWWCTCFVCSLGLALVGEGFSGDCAVVFLVNLHCAVYNLSAASDVDFKLVEDVAAVGRAQSGFAAVGNLVASGCCLGMCSLEHYCLDKSTILVEGELAKSNICVHVARIDADCQLSVEAFLRIACLSVGKGILSVGIVHLSNAYHAVSAVGNKLDVEASSLGTVITGEVGHAIASVGSRESVALVGVVRINVGILQ